MKMIVLTPPIPQNFTTATVLQSPMNFAHLRLLVALQVVVSRVSFDRNDWGPTGLAHVLRLLITNQLSLNAMAHLSVFNLNDTDARVERLQAAIRLLYTLKTNASDQQESYRAVEVSRILCEMLADTTSNTQAAVSCPYQHDLITCWPATPVGSVATRPCPAYVAWTRAEGSVENRCGPGGNWSYQPDSLAEFCRQYGHCHSRDCLAFYNSNDSPSASAERTGDDSVAEAVAKLIPLPASVVILKYFALAGYLVSLLATLGASLIFVSFKQLHCPRNFVHIHILAAFFCRALLSLIELGWLLDEEDLKADEHLLDGPSQHHMTKWLCRAFVTVWIYSILASFMWMFVEALFLHNVVYFNVFKETGVTPYFLLGWGVPLVVVGAFVAVRAVYDNNGCWIAYVDVNHMWIVKGPIIMTFCLNFFIFINVTRILVTKTTDQNHQEVGKYRKLAKSTAVLTVLFGLHYFLLAFPIHLLDLNTLNLPLIVFLFVEIISTSLQGFLVSFVYCLNNSEVKSELSRAWRLWLSPDSIRSPTTSAQFQPASSGSTGRRRVMSRADETILRRNLSTHLELVGSDNPDDNGIATQFSSLATTRANSIAGVGVIKRLPDRLKWTNDLIVDTL